MMLEGDFAEEVLALLPEELMLGSTRAIGLETFKLCNPANTARVRIPLGFKPAQ